MSVSPSKRFTVLQPRTADRPGGSGGDKDACWDLLCGMFSDPKHALCQLNAIKWRGDSASESSSRSRSLFLLSPDAALASDLEQLQADELRMLVKSLREEVKNLRASSGSTVTVKKDPGEGGVRGRADSSFPASLPEKLALNSELDSEAAHSESVAAQAAAPAAGRARGSKANLISGLVSTITMGMVDMAAQSPAPSTSSAQPQPGGSPSRPSAVAVAATTPKTNASSSASSSPNPAPSPASAMVSSDHGVDISYIGSQRLVRRLPDAAAGGVDKDKDNNKGKDQEKDKEAVTSSSSSKSAAPNPPALSRSTSASASSASASPAVAVATAAEPERRRATTTVAKPTTSSSSNSASPTQRIAEGMTLTTLVMALRAALSLNQELSVSEAVSAACSALGVVPTGVAKTDAVACFLALPDEMAAHSSARSTARAIPAAASAAKLDAADLSERVQAFYTKHNPDKTAAEITDILQHYQGREKELVRKLEKKYNCIFE